MTGVYDLNTFVRATLEDRVDFPAGQGKDILYSFLLERSGNQLASVNPGQ
jgi:hypothetical protein